MRFSARRALCLALAALLWTGLAFAEQPAWTPRRHARTETPARVYDEYEAVWDGVTYRAEASAFVDVEAAGETALRVREDLAALQMFFGLEALPPLTVVFVATGHSPVAPLADTYRVEDTLVTDVRRVADGTYLRVLLERVLGIGQPWVACGLGLALRGGDVGQGAWAADADASSLFALCFLPSMQEEAALEDSLAMAGTFFRDLLARGEAQALAVIQDEAALAEALALWLAARGLPAEGMLPLLTEAGLRVSYSMDAHAVTLDMALAGYQISLSGLTEGAAWFAREIAANQKGLLALRAALADFVPAPGRVQYVLTGARGDTATTNKRTGQVILPPSLLPAAGLHEAVHVFTPYYGEDFYQRTEARYPGLAIYYIEGLAQYYAALVGDGQAALMLECLQALMAREGEAVVWAYDTAFDGAMADAVLGCYLGNGGGETAGTFDRALFIDAIAYALHTHVPGTDAQVNRYPLYESWMRYLMDTYTEAQVWAAYAQLPTFDKAFATGYAASLAEWQAYLAALSDKGEAGR